MTDSGVPLDNTIYPMPMFATFRVADVAAAERFYTTVGFVPLATIPGPDGTTALVHLRRMRHQDLLLVPGEPAPGSTTVSFAAGGEDLEALAERLRAADPAPYALDGPSDTPWFTRDLTIDDPDGNRVVLTAPREAELDQARAWARESITGDYVVPDAR